ncbi:MAG: UxaA family hydrolase, partial [Clostridiales bacterium]|nr:UxaA family hydrolase [Clostridiales bacterium]
MPKLIKIHPNDNCAVAVSEIKKGESIEGLSALSDIPFGHKIDLFDIAAGETVIKYGYPIGVAIKEIKKGEHI